MKTSKWLIACIALGLATSSNADPDVTKTFSTLVDKEGNISLPIEFRRTWTFLGTWSVANSDVAAGSAASGHGAAGLHNVYVQPSAVTAYRKTGEFPDGTVLVKELLKARN
jgi:hypothetical protein